MKTRIGIAALFAVVLALPISVGLASANAYPIGKAAFSSTSGITGAAFVTRQLTSNQTHVALRLSGLTSGQVLTWQIVGGAACGATPTSTLLTKVGSSTATTQGTVMTSDYVAGTLSVTSGSAMMTVRVYDYSKGAIGSELACAQIYGQPSMGSNHWW